MITALVDHHGHIPYRDSKLTRILQESLGGKVKIQIKKFYFYFYSKYLTLKTRCNKLTHSPYMYDIDIDRPLNLNLKGEDLHHRDPIAFATQYGGVDVYA